MEKNQEDICSICYEILDKTEEKQFWILECNHKFHTFCIMKWFRNDNSSCPLCNDSIQYTKLTYWDRINTINEIKQLGKKKNCPEKIKKILDKIKKVKDKEKKQKNYMKEFKNKYKKEINEYLELIKQKQKFKRKIINIERQLLTFIKINHIYIRKK